MRSNHGTAPDESPETYRESYGGFTVVLTTRWRGLGLEWNARAYGEVTWLSSGWGRSWLGLVEIVRAQIDRYNRALCFCGLSSSRRMQALSVGVVELPDVPPELRS